jgi:hypothetical protein
MARPADDGPRPLITIKEPRRPADSGEGNEKDEDGCGLSFRTPGKCLLATITATGRVWGIEGHDMLTGPRELRGGSIALIPFGYDMTKFHLAIHGNPRFKGDPEMGLAPILMQIAEGYRRTLHADGERILRIEIRDDAGNPVEEDEIENWQLRLEASTA